MKKFKISFAILSLTLVLFTACDQDDDGETVPQEVITTVELEFLEPVDSVSRKFFVSDTDGEGGNPPLRDTIRLSSFQVYSVFVKFYDNSDTSNGGLDLTPEVMAEDTVHLVCFDATGAAVEPTILDIDDNGKPLGLSGTVVFEESGNGQLTVRLKHQPDKDAADPCTTGDTDVEATFPVIIQ